MTGPVAPEDVGRRLVELVDVRRAALTVEQRERRAVLDARTRAMAAGVWKPPRSLFGKPKKP